MRRKTGASQKVRKYSNVDRKLNSEKEVCCCQQRKGQDVRPSLFTTFSNQQLSYSLFRAGSGNDLLLLLLLLLLMLARTGLIDLGVPKDAVVRSIDVGPRTCGTRIDLVVD